MKQFAESILNNIHCTRLTHSGSGIFHDISQFLYESSREITSGMFGACCLIGSITTVVKQITNLQVFYTLDFVITYEISINLDISVRLGEED